MNIPVILATAGIHRRDSGDIIAQAIIAAFLLFARSANHLAKQDGKMRLCAGRLCRPLITGGKAAAGGLPFSAINRRLRFRANGKMAKGWIPAYAGMTGKAGMTIKKITKKLDIRGFLCIMTFVGGRSHWHNTKEKT